MSVIPRISGRHPLILDTSHISQGNPIDAQSESYILECSVSKLSNDDYFNNNAMTISL